MPDNFRKSAFSLSEAKYNAGDISYVFNCVYIDFV